MARRTIRRGGPEWAHARVGVVLIVGLALLGYGIFRVGEMFDVFADRYELVTLVPSAVGLMEGAPVHLAGQRVGQVDEIDFIPMRRKIEEHHVLIRLSIAEEVREQIRADSRAHIRTQGLLGDKFVDIDPGTARAAVLAPGDTLPTVRPFDVDDLLGRASETVEEVRQTAVELHQITSAVNRGEGTLGQLVNNEALYARLTAASTELQAFLVEVNRGEGTLGRLVRDPEIYRRLQSAAARVDSVTAGILRGRGSLGRLVQSDSLYRRLYSAAARADTAAGGLAQTVGQLNHGDGTLQRLISDPAAYDEFLKAVVELQNVLKDIRADPKRYRPDVHVKVF
ncbi:MAG: MCE family protein [Gemmatimonadetes bacterium]|nr:MCE family protein [Gemmatimonadota bacterium]